MSTIDQRLPLIRRFGLHAALARLKLLPAQRDVQALALMAVLVLIFFLPVLAGGHVLLPVDNLWQKEPWRSSAAQFGIQYPHNHLISDMIVQNLGWKNFARDSILSGQIPLWNPYLLAGVPFLAAGQYGVLYPLGILFYIMPPEYAYLPFTAIHLWLAGVFMYIFVRVLGAQRFGALAGGISFMFCGFLIVSFLWPMIISTIIYAPLVLAMVEMVIRSWETLPRMEALRPNDLRRTLELNQRDAERIARVRQGRLWLLYVLIGSIAIGLQFLAGHMEMSYLLLFSAGFYAALRLTVMLWRTRDVVYTVLSGFSLLGMVALGAGLAAAQILPFIEAIGANFRSNFVTTDQIISYALPWKHVISTVLPNFYGNPSQHEYYDLTTRSIQEVSNATPDGQVFHFIQDWGAKNYVEGTLYVGILPLLLAGIALLYRRSYATAILTIYLVWSLLLAFGTPLYRLVMLLPGSDQLHTPFRWIIPYTICLTALAGLGADVIAKSKVESLKSKVRGIWGIAWAALAAGLVGLAACAVVFALPQRFLGIAGRLSERLKPTNPKFIEAFSSPAMFMSFEWAQVLVFALMLAASGAVLLLALKSKAGSGGVALWKVLALGLITVDLLAFGMNFNTASDPALLRYTPPVVEFLQNQEKQAMNAPSQNPFRVIAFGDDILPPNTAMLERVQDARGYDTIIPKQYTQFWSGMEQPSGLLYSMIDRIANPQSLTSPLLDVLNVRYILSSQPLNLPGISEVAVPNGGNTHVYINENVMPRAWVSGAVEVLDDQAIHERLKASDWNPRQTTLLDQRAPKLDTSDPSLFGQVKPQITSYTPNAVEIGVTMPERGYLVLADSYFPGWQAMVSTKVPAGDTGWHDNCANTAKPGEWSKECEHTIYQADGNFRAIELNAGEYIVRFKYNPLPFKLGLFTTVASLIALAGGFSVVIWQPLSRRRDEENLEAVQQITKNSITPMATSLINKAISFGFALVMLRLLGPLGNGYYALAIAIFGYFDIFVNFGLSTLLTREVARDRSYANANRYLSNTIILRMLLTLLSTPLMLGIIWMGNNVGSLNWEPVAMLAFGLFFLGLIPGNISAAFSALFYAYERMEYPAAISVVTTLVQVALGATVLVFGWGIIGLAAVSIITNTITALIFAFFGLLVLFRPHFEVDPRLLRSMIATSYPLMLNNMLNGLFFRIDSMLLPSLRKDGNLELGWYNAAYKFIDGLNIIPSTLTLAIFPLMSRYAGTQQEGLTRAFRMAVKVLLLCSLPISVGTMLVATPIISLSGGEAYIPHSAIALAILIWFLPFSYVNSVTHYVLIANDRQRWVTISFLIALPFNIVANFILIPPYGYTGAAITTILSEVILLIPFWIGLHRSGISIPLFSMLWRPLLAAAVMGIAVYFLRDVNLIAAIAGGAVVYVGMLFALHAFDDDDKLLFRRLTRRA